MPSPEAPPGLPRPSAVDELDARTRAAIAAGARWFDAGRFFEAHEAWEDAWRLQSGEVRRLLQGLIQLAAAFHKGLVQRRPGGMVRLLDAALPKLDAAGGPEALGLADVRASARAWREAAARRAAGGAPPGPALPRFGV